MDTKCFSNDNFKDNGNGGGNHIQVLHFWVVWNRILIRSTPSVFRHKEQLFSIGENLGQSTILHSETLHEGNLYLIE